MAPKHTPNCAASSTRHQKRNEGVLLVSVAQLLLAVLVSPGAPISRLASMTRCVADPLRQSFNQASPDVGALLACMRPQFLLAVRRAVIAASLAPGTLARSPF